MFDIYMSKGLFSIVMMSELLMEQGQFVDIDIDEETRRRDIADSDARMSYLLACVFRFFFPSRQFDKSE